MRRLPSIFIALAVAGLIATACSTAPAGSSAPQPTVALPSVVLPSVVLPSAPPSVALPSVALPSAPPSVALPSAPPSVALPSVVLPSAPPSVALPSVVLPSAPPSVALPSVALPSFRSDEDLAALFPTEIAGAPVEVQTWRAADFLEVFEPGSEELAGFEQFLTAIGVGADAISIGVGQFSYEEEDQEVSALRAAGADGDRFLQALVAFTQNEADDPTSVAVSQGTVGGKPVTIVTDSTDESTSYLYSRGEVIFVIETEDPALADTVMAALP